MNLNYLKFIKLLFSAIVLASCQAHDYDRSAQFQVGDSSYSEVVEIKNGKFSKWVLKNNETVKNKISSRVLTRSELTWFWKSLEDEGVYKWLSSYKARELDDRSAFCNWMITIIINKNIFQSIGDAAFPSDSDPKMVTQLDETERFIRVSNIFYGLTAKQKQALAPINKKK